MSGVSFRCFFKRSIAIWPCASRPFAAGMGRLKEVKEAQRARRHALTVHSLGANLGRVSFLVLPIASSHVPLAGGNLLAALCVSYAWCGVR